MVVKEFLQELSLRDLTTIAGGWGIQALTTLSAIPYLIRHLSPLTFTAVFFIVGGVVGLLSTHVTNRIVGTKTKVKTSMKEDAIRGAIYLLVEVGLGGLILLATIITGLVSN